MIESKYLKENTHNIQQLMAIPGLKKFKTSHLSYLLRQSKIRQYEHGEIIIKEGDKDPWYYFLLSGKVKVLKQEEEISVIDSRGEILGEMSLFDGSARSTTVRSEGKTVCLAVDSSASNRQVAEEERTEHLLMMYRIFMGYLTNRLRMRTEEVAESNRENKRLRKEIERLKQTRK